MIDTQNKRLNTYYYLENQNIKLKKYLSIFENIWNKHYFIHFETLYSAKNQRSDTIMSLCI